MIGSPAAATRHRGLRQNELRLAGADQLDIDFGQQLGVEQRAVLGAAGIVDRIARAQIVEPVRAAGMLAAGKQKRIDHALARDQRPAGALELGIEKAEIERGIVDDERRVAEEGDQIVRHLGEKELVLEKFVAQAVNRERLRRHAAFAD